MDIKESEILGADAGGHWYYRSKSAAVRRLLRPYRFRQIADVGAGSGFFSRDLLAHTDAAAATCVDLNYAQDGDDCEAGKPVHFRRKLDAGKGSDLLLLMDVLEHVADDRALLLESLTAAVPGALVLISVPAFRFMWSAHDEFLGHHRRYTLGEVETLVERAGLVRLRGCYFFGAALPLAFLVRKLTFWRRSPVPESDLKRHNGIVNAVMTALCACELPLLRFNRLAGLTVFCLARVPEGAAGV